MNAAQIDTINELLPGTKSKSLLGASSSSKEEQYKAIDNFVDKYTNLAYGWFAAREFARSRKPFPVLMRGTDHWVFRAYLFQLNPSKYKNRAVAEAYAMSQARLDSITRVVKALLVVPGTTFQDVSNRTGIREDVIEAYATLFYNVHDRRDDHAYLAQAVYPDTRFVTLREGYFENASVSDLLIRAGYESGSSDAVSFMAGMNGSNYLDKLATDPGNAERLEGKIMANAINLATVGLVNQRLLGLQQSRALMVADKQGGVETKSSPVMNIAASVLSHLTEADEIHNSNRRQYFNAQKEAQVVDVN